MALKPGIRIVQHRASEFPVGEPNVDEYGFANVPPLRGGRDGKPLS